MLAARDLPGGIASNSGRCRGCGLDCYCQAVGGEGGGSRSRGSCQATCRSCNSCACVPIILPSSGMRCSTPRLQGSVACLKNSLPWNEIPYTSPLQRPPGQTYFPSSSYGGAGRSNREFGARDTVWTRTRSHPPPARPSHPPCRQSARQTHLQHPGSDAAKSVSCRTMACPTKRTCGTIHSTVRWVCKPDSEACAFLCLLMTHVGCPFAQVTRRR